MNIKKVMKRALGIPSRQAVVDPYLYQENYSSIAGNSLNESHIFAVTNLAEDSEICFELSNRLIEENAEPVIATSRIFLNDDTINEKCDESKMIIDHFINIYDLKYLDCQFHIDEFYKNLQIEANYLIERDRQGGGICSIILYDQDEVLAKSSEALIKGLGVALGNHNIISNGVIAKSNVSHEAIAASMFLSSKYGQLLTGECLHFEKG